VHAPGIGDSLGAAAWFSLQGAAAGGEIWRFQADFRRRI